jgi:hypothetical protein
LVTFVNFLHLGYSEQRNRVAASSRLYRCIGAPQSGHVGLACTTTRFAPRVNWRLQIMQKNRCPPFRPLPYRYSALDPHDGHLSSGMVLVDGVGTLIVNQTAITAPSILD